MEMAQNNPKASWPPWSFLPALSEFLVANHRTAVKMWAERTQLPTGSSWTMPDSLSTRALNGLVLLRPPRVWTEVRSQQPALLGVYFLLEGTASAKATPYTGQGYTGYKGIQGTKALTLRGTTQRTLQLQSLMWCCYQGLHFCFTAAHFFPCLPCCPGSLHTLSRRALPGVCL